MEIQHLKEILELQVKHLKELLEEKDRALDLQAREYERRLGILNGEAERLRNMQASYVPREVYESESKEINNKVQLLIDKQNRQSGWVAAISIILTLGMFALNYFR